MNEVDSFNPFNGYQATSYEMWALMYDYMVGYSMEDMSPAPALATSWETSDDGLTWTNLDTLPRGAEQLLPQGVARDLDSALAVRAAGRRGA